MHVNTSGKKTLVISIYKRHGAVLFKGYDTIKIISINKNKTLQIVPQSSTI